MDEHIAHIAHRTYSTINQGLLLRYIMHDLFVDFTGGNDMISLFEENRVISIFALLPRVLSSYFSFFNTSILEILLLENLIWNHMLPLSKATC